VYKKAIMAVPKLFKVYLYDSASSDGSENFTPMYISHFGRRTAFKVDESDEEIIRQKIFHARRESIHRELCKDNLPEAEQRRLYRLLNNLHKEFHCSPCSAAAWRLRHMRDTPSDLPTYYLNINDLPTKWRNLFRKKRYHNYPALWKAVEKKCANNNENYNAAQVFSIAKALCTEKPRK
jgi:hypothetical protein